MKTPSDNDVVQTAAEWLLRLDSPGMDSAEVRAAFETWQNADPRHREATQTMQPLVNQMRQWKQAPAGERIAAGHALRSRPGRAGVRRTLSGITLALLLLLAGSGWWWGQGLPASAWLADASTAAGDTRELSLADGSRVPMWGLLPGEVATEILDKRPVPVSAEDRAKMAQSEDVGDLIRYIACLPPHIVINEVMINPTWNRGYVASLQRGKS